MVPQLYHNWHQHFLSNLAAVGRVLDSEFKVVCLAFYQIEHTRSSSPFPLFTFLETYLT